MLIRKLQRNSLKTRVTLFTLGIFLTSIWSLALYTSQMLHHDTQRMLSAQQFSTVSLVAKAINHEFSDRLAALRKMATATGPVMPMGATQLQTSLEAHPIFQTLFNGGAFITGLDGKTLASVPLGPSRLGVNYLDRDYIFAAIRRGEAAIGKPVVGRVLQSPVIGMAVPIHDAQGAVVGAIAGVISLASVNFLDDLMANSYGQTGSFLLVAPQYRLIVTGTDKTRSMEILPDPGVSPTLDRFIDGYEGSDILVNPQGVEVLASVKRVPMAGWYVAVMLPVTEVFAPVRSMQDRMLLTALLLTLLTGALTWWMLRRELEPLQTIARTLTEFSRGNLPLQALPISRRDEIGELIMGFNHLQGTLRQREHSLIAREERYRVLFDRAIDGIMVFSATGKLLAVNQSFASMHGYTIEEMLLLKLKDFERPDHPEIAAERLRRLLKGEAMTFEVTHLHKKGHALAMEVSASLTDVDGQALVQSFHRDITERKQNESRLQLLARRSEVLLRLPAAADGKDEQAFLAHGLAQVEALTDSQMAFAHFVPDDQETIEMMTWSTSTMLHFPKPLAGTANSLNEAGIWANALRQRTHVLINDYANEAAKRGLPDGHAQLNRFLSVPVIQGGAVRMVIGLANKQLPYTELDVETTRLMADAIWRIVNQRRADHAMHQSQKSLKEAQFIAGLGSYVLDISRGVWESSEALDELFGIDRHYERSVAGWEDLIHREDRAMMIDHFANEVVGLGEGFNREYRIVRYDNGAEKWVRGLGKLEFDNKGKPQQLHGTIQDITDIKLAEAALRQSEERYRTVFQTSPDGVTVNRMADGHYLDVNDGFTNLIGWQLEEVIGKTSREINVWRHSADQKRLMKALQDHGFCREMEVELVKKNGQFLTALLSAQVMTLDGVPCILYITRDITERKQAEAKIQLAADVFTYAREGIIITAVDGNIVDVNEAFTRITGFDRDEVLGKNPRILNSGLQDKAFFDAMWRSLVAVGHWNGEIWNRRKSGESYAVMQTISAIKDVRGATVQYVSLFSDVTAVKKHQHQLEHIAHFDTLTNLPNRVLLADRLGQAMAQCQRREQRIAVAYLDLDGFKMVNDRYGHEAGDQLLIAVAAAMTQTMREGDTLARLGGDEFVAVLLDLADIDASEPMINRLLAAASLPVQLDDLTLQVSASIGITFYPQAQEMDADQLLRQADQAMYQAKLAGKARYNVFDAVEDRTLRIRYESLERIRHALVEHEFVLHYQPKVNMRTGEVIGAEALIRWQHPERGLLTPDLFLPVIESHLLSVAVGEWVINTALTQIELWKKIGLDMHVSVNIGARQLQQPDFVARLQSLLASHPLVDPAYLELEILETSALEDVAQISKVIEDCTRLDVTCSLDDFGTGYSSLTYLKRLQVTQLKIDKSFVRDMLINPDDLAILVGIIGLASAFKREVIAEGVETVAHGILLRQMGCELAQGFAIARPMPSHELPQWVAKWEPAPSWLDL
jgi:diguanylate cyclase (GGDEF)-like protein/PAS domain S-box-containing protein